MNNLRGKVVTINGGNVVNDIKIAYSELFDADGGEELSIKFPSDISVSLTSNDGIDTDYNTITAGNELVLSGITYTNIKIKSATTQTGYIYTAQAVYK